MSIAVGTSGAAVNLRGAPQALSTRGVGASNLVHISTRGAHNPPSAGLSSGSYTNGFFCGKYPIASPAASLILAWTNGENQGGGSPAYSDTFTIQATVELIDGTIIPVTFAGASSVTIASGSVQLVLADAITGHGFSVGDWVWVKTLVTVATLGLKWPAFQFVALAGDSSVQSNASLAGLLTTPYEDIIKSSGAEGAYGPLALLAPRTLASRPVVVGIGDSLMVNPDSTAGNYENGWVSTALGGTFPYLDLAIYGEQGSTNAPSTYGGPVLGPFALRAQLAAVADYVIDGYGTNDINAGAKTAAQVEAMGINFAGWVVSNGSVYIGTTLPPSFASSTDSFSTLVNQTPASTLAVRVAINTWRRAGFPINASTFAPVAVGTPGALLMGQPGHPVSGLIDVATAVESSLNSGLWKVTGSPFGYTGDSAHFSDLGTNTVAALFDAKILLGNSEFVVPRFSLPISPTAPTVMSGLQAYLNSDSLPPGALASWPDLSGNGLNGAVVGSPTVLGRVDDANGNPLLRGRPVVHFPGVANAVDFGASLATPFEVFMVLRAATTAPATQALLTSASGLTFLSLGTGATITFKGLGTVTKYDWADFHIISYTYANPSGTDEARVDGEIVATATANAPSTFNSYGLGGASGSGVQPFAGEIPFVCTLSGIASETARIALLKWISNKYAIPLV